MPATTHLSFRLALAICLAYLGLTPGLLRADVPAVGHASAAQQVAARLTPFLHAIRGETEQFRLGIDVALPIDGKSQTIAGSFTRYDADAFDLVFTHPDYALALRRRTDGCALALPKHGVVHVGEGSGAELIATKETLHLHHIAASLISDRTAAKPLVALLRAANPQTFVTALSWAGRFEFDPEDGTGSVGDVSFTFDRNTLSLASGTTRVTLTLSEVSSDPKSVAEWPNLTLKKRPRVELERSIARGLRRTLEVLAPASTPTAPIQPRAIPHGRLLDESGHRVALLWGTPEEIGTAHGMLLKDEARLCIDSVLHAFGLVQTIRTGRWFADDLAAAYKRLAPHIPERHKRETRALSRAIGVPERQAEVLNVFPELFHCSGFAVFGSATADGTLYHGRVLDYMTTIGLQDASVTFVVRPEGQHAFLNVGYAGFVGSVTGMNEKQISLGEMGGRGEGQWDGVPMATLMRRALEECDTLADVQTLWATSPRTCEYYYVFADGKDRTAVGVAATPETIAFVKPGQAHERLGEGITDAVVLSAGDRLTCLRERVTRLHGTINEQDAVELMSRPVAMKSNLHNALFVPEHLRVHIANADHERPAAECKYVTLKLRELLTLMP